MENLLTIGKIVNTHGIKGELRIKPITDKLETFDKIKKVYVVGKSTKEYEIQSVRHHKSFVLIRFKGLEDINEAELLKTYDLKIAREDAIALEEDEYYISDLYEMAVITEEGRALGHIKDILFTGSNDVYVVRDEQAQKEILIPAIKQCILKIDVTQKEMIVHLLEGLEG